MRRTDRSKHLEMLRLRLRVAMFKVQTNQTNLPLSECQVLSKDTTLSSKPQPPTLSTEIPKPPRLLPAPILKPTTFSARIATQNQMLSSPPSSTEGSPKRKSPSLLFRTPALPQRRMRQTSSPPNSRGREEDAEDRDDESLSSSMVRGRAAIGLLGLKDDSLK